MADIPELHLTPTRMDLLQAVAERRVLEGITEDSEGHTWLVEEGMPRNRKVCARIRELEQAGYVTLAGLACFWELTDAAYAKLRWHKREVW